jgi:hypothetical protein
MSRWSSWILLVALLIQVSADHIRSIDKEGGWQRLFTCFTCLDSNTLRTDRQRGQLLRPKGVVEGCVH